MVCKKSQLTLRFSFRHEFCSAKFARLAQLVERVIDVDDAGGSNPSPRTKFA